MPSPVSFGMSAAQPAFCAARWTTAAWRFAPPVVHGFEPRRGGRPFLMAEIAVAGAGREHQHIVGQPAPVYRDASVGDVHAGDLAAQHAQPGVIAEHAAHWDSDVARRESSGCHLVKQRLEQMVIVPIDKCDPRAAPNRAPMARQHRGRRGWQHHGCRGWEHRGRQPRLQPVQPPATAITGWSIELLET